ncbi:hypothetical protein NQ317_007533, partial [Molorchus minor]
NRESIWGCPAVHINELASLEKTQKTRNITNSRAGESPEKI